MKHGLEGMVVMETGLEADQRSTRNAGCPGTFPNARCLGTFLSSSNQFNFFLHQLFLIISYYIAISNKMTYLDVAAERQFAFQNKYLIILGSFCYEVKWNMHQLHTVKA